MFCSIYSTLVLINANGNGQFTKFKKKMITLIKDVVINLE